MSQANLKALTRKPVRESSKSGGSKVFSTVPLSSHPDEPDPARRFGVWAGADSNGSARHQEEA
jgi:hypothetical protein